MAINYLLIVLLAVVFAVIMAIGQGFYWTYTSRRLQEREELARRLGTLQEEEAESLFREKAKDTAAGALGTLGKHLQDLLIEAESTMSVSALLGRMGLIGFAVGLLGLLFLFPFGVILGPISAIVPYIIIRTQAAARTKKLLEQLPDALDLMARSLQAGLGLSDAFRMCAEEMPLPLAQEFGRVFEEVRFGRDYRDALGNLLDRNPRLFELRIFVSSVLLQRETGGNLIEILNTIATTIRNRFLFQAKVRALTAEAKFSAMILGALPLGVAVMIMFVNSTYLLPLLYDPLGNLMLAYFFGSYGLGSFIMYTLSKVEV